MNQAQQQQQQVAAVVAAVAQKANVIRRAALRAAVGVMWKVRASQCRIASFTALSQHLVLPALAHRSIVLVCERIYGFFMYGF